MRVAGIWRGTDNNPRHSSSIWRGMDNTPLIQGERPLMHAYLTRLSAARMLSQHLWHSSTCPQVGGQQDGQGRLHAHRAEQRPVRPPHQQQGHGRSRCGLVRLPLLVVPPAATVTQPVAATGGAADACGCGCWVVDTAVCADMWNGRYGFLAALILGMPGPASCNKPACCEGPACSEGPACCEGPACLQTLSGFHACEIPGFPGAHCSDSMAG